MLIFLLAVSSSVQALNKGTAEDAITLPGLIDKIIPTAQVNTATPPPIQPAQPVQQEPAKEAAATEPKVESSFTTKLDKLTEEYTLLEQKEKNAKLKESIIQHGGNIEMEQATNTDTFTDTGTTEISVRLIYGVGGLYHAIIVNKGIELTVGQGTDIDGNWKVTSISATTVRLKDKDSHTLNLSLSRAISEQKPRSIPQQRQPQQSNTIQPVMPQALLPGQTAQ